MGLLSFLSPNKTSNATTNTTQVSSVDTRVAATDDAIAVGQDGFLDQSVDFVDASQVDNSVYFSDQSQTDNSVVFRDESDRSVNDYSDRSMQVYDSRDLSTTINDHRVFNSLDSDVAKASVLAGRDLGASAFSLVNEGIKDQVEAAKKSRDADNRALSLLTASSSENLLNTLKMVSEVNGGALTLAARGQEESAAARAGANETIKEVLSFKEAGDTKVAQDLIKWGGLAVAVFVLAFLFRPKRA